MKALDLYIIKRLLSTFLFVVFILVLIIVVIDMAENVDKFAKADLTSWQVFGYYLDFIPWIASLIMPITMFIATVYVTSRMAAHTEIIAMLSSGISFRRLLVPYLIGSGLIAVVSFYLNGWLIPISNKSLVSFRVQYLKSQYYYDKRNFHIQVAPDVYLYMRSYDNRSNTGFNFTLEKIKDEHLIEKLSAKTIQWDSLKQKWKLTSWEINEVSAIFDSTYKSRGVPEDEGTRRRYSASPIDTALAISPEEFKSDYRKFDGMTIDELTSYIKTLQSRGTAGVEQYQVEKYMRYAHPFTLMILTLMGVITSSRKSRGGTGFQIALGFLLSFIFILFFMIFRTFADTGAIQPIWISVWIPSGIFGLLTLWMYKYVPR